jgi:hypothetical protein
MKSPFRLRIPDHFHRVHDNKGEAFILLFASFSLFITMYSLSGHTNDRGNTMEVNKGSGAGHPGECELSILMPCLNESETVDTCIEKARTFLESSQIEGEVIVSDNGSTDGSQSIATDCGARVVNISQRGYGNALIGGIRAARGRYVIKGDSDDSYDFLGLDLFMVKLREGYKLVMGNRFKGGIKPGAMPALHRYLGNPVLSGLGRLLFRSPVGDFHCGLRGFDKTAIERLELRSAGMEFASEMVVKATLAGLKITEVPTTLSPDGRSSPPHLQTWQDGWRHGTEGLLSASGFQKGCPGSGKRPWGR